MRFSHFLCAQVSIVIFDDRLRGWLLSEKKGIQPETDAGRDLYDGRTGWHRVPVDVVRSDA